MTPSTLEAAPSTSPAAPAPARSLGSAVVVHGGARDSYQVALALHEAGLLDTLVTDLYFPARSRLAALLPAALREQALHRSHPGLPARSVRQCIAAGLRELLLPRLGLPFRLRRRSTRASDHTLGVAAGRLARRHGTGLVTYSYYAFDAIRAYRGPALLFQVHPHPATMRRLLRQELALHPDCAPSLTQEWELALPEQDYQRLVDEPQLASSFLVASSFTRSSLVEHGIPAHRITVIPYGVDLARFHPDPQRQPTPHEPLRLLFVGRINQRKGIKYLLQALELLPPGTVRLTVCGRVVDGLDLFRNLPEVEVRPSVSEADLVRAYQEADLFVFPSVAEGFGQVLLEALASGLPILSTPHTAAPDLITPGVEGLIVPPGRADLLAEQILWASTHRHELEAMRAAARRRAEHFTWARFRTRVAEAVEQYLSHPDV